jgi:hypothetical protein
MTFGFDGARGTNVRPSHKTAVSSWAKDESAPGVNDGTVLTASWANRVAGNLRQLATRFGITLTETSDNDLADCIVAAIVATDPKSHHHDALYYPRASVDALLAALAPLASPALTGTPIVPTATPGTNTTQIASTAFVQAAIAALINAAPGALNTLDELAAALGDDANFAATMTTALALKAPLASPALTGAPTAPTPTAGDNSTKIATTAYVDGAVAGAAGVSDGDKGDITVSGGGSAWSIENDVVTYDKLQNVSASSRLLARKTAGAGNVEECTLSELLDFIGSAAQGDILYRGSSGWARLGAGTAGQVFTTGGAAANPAYTTALGKCSIPIPAVAMYGRTTNGAAAGTVEATTNKNMVKSLDFDASSQEFAQFAISMPKRWDESTITASFVWSHASTSTNFGVVWALEAVAYSDGDDLDTAFGTAQQVADTGGTTNRRYRTAETPAVTIAGTPQAEDWVLFQVKRVPADGSDTMAIDARLEQVILHINVNAFTDA